MNFIMANRTKILGMLVAVISATSLMTQSMTFDGLLEPDTIRWIAIICSLIATALGVLTTGVGMSNTANIRVEEARAAVATAMTTALNTPPPPPSSQPPASGG